MKDLFLAQYEALKEENNSRILGCLFESTTGHIEVEAIRADEFLNKDFEYAYRVVGNRMTPRRGFEELKGFEKVIIKPTSAGKVFVKDGVERVCLYGLAQKVFVEFKG